MRLAVAPARGRRVAARRRRIRALCEEKAEAEGVEKAKIGEFTGARWEQTKAGQKAEERGDCEDSRFVQEEAEVVKRKIISSSLP